MQYMCIKRKRDNSYKVVFSLSLSCSKCWQHGLSVKGICFQIWIWAIERYRQWFGIHNNSQGCRRQPRTCIDAISVEMSSKCRCHISFQDSYMHKWIITLFIYLELVMVFSDMTVVFWRSASLPPPPRFTPAISVALHFGGNNGDGFYIISKHMTQTEKTEAESIACT